MITSITHPGPVTQATEPTTPPLDGPTANERELDDALFGSGTTSGGEGDD